MHESVMAWVESVLSPDEVVGCTVLEVGAYDVNGSVRPVVEALGPQSYVGVDREAGPGVDLVVDCDGLVRTFGAGGFEIVISTEMLEHVEDWQAAVVALCEMVAPGGLLLVTTRSEGFGYHAHPGDWWRYSVASMRAILAAAGFDALDVISDPQAAGVFAKARKPQRWTPQFDLLAGAGVTPMPQP